MYFLSSEFLRLVFIDGNIFPALIGCIKENEVMLLLIVCSFEWKKTLKTTGPSMWDWLGLATQRMPKVATTDGDLRHSRDNHHTNWSVHNRFQ